MKEKGRTTLLARKQKNYGKTIVISQTNKQINFSTDSI
jgi:hypothetical protein